MKNKIWILFAMIVILSMIISFSFIGCREEIVEETTAEETTAAETTEAESTAEEVVAETEEEYFLVTILSGHPLFLTHDYPVVQQLANELGVKVTFTGPKELDVEAANATLEQLVPIKPAGVMLHSMGEVHNASIDKLVEAGIPVVCFDGANPNSKALASVWTDWKALGEQQAKLMGNLLGGKGKVVLLACIPNDKNAAARQGYADYMALNFPDIEIVDTLNDESDVELAADLTAKAIQAYGDDIDGFTGFDGSSGPGMATAVREAGMAGKYIVTCVDDTEDIIQGIKDGIINATLVQKREAFCGYAFMILYDYNHPGTEIFNRYKDAGFAMTPKNVYTDTMILTKDNVDQLQEVYDYIETIK